jgi:hypothetical protein
MILEIEAKNNMVWKTDDGKYIYVSEIQKKDLENIINILENKRKNLLNKIKNIHNYPIPDSDNAYDLWQSGVEKLESDILTIGMQIAIIKNELECRYGTK